MSYKDELTKAMTNLGQLPNSIFMGQAVACEGTGMSATFVGVPRDKLLELPVFESTQLGMAIGMSLAGYLPIAIFPRWNFLLGACDQLINHLDCMERYSYGKYNPKVIIRTAVATDQPLNPGYQHLGNFCEAFSLIFHKIIIVEILDKFSISSAYKKAATHSGPTLLVEHMALYND